MTTREDERPSFEAKFKTKTLTDLALELIKDDPEATDAKLKRRWIRLVEDDEDLLNECLEVQAVHEIKIARNTLAREKKKTAETRQTGQKKRKSVSQKFKETVTETRRTLFNLKAENGKDIRALTGDELAELETNNATRAKLYRELGKLVKGSAIVGDVLDDKKFAAIVKKIGDVRELSKLFD